MEDPNKVSVFQLGKDIFYHIFKLFNDIRNLAKLEVKLARESFVKILILSFLLLTIAMTTWFCVVALVIASLVVYGFTLLAAIGMTVLVNLILIAILSAFIFKLKDDLSFNATRRQITHTKTLIKG